MFDALIFNGYKIRSVQNRIAGFATPKRFTQIERDNLKAHQKTLHMPFSSELNKLKDFIKLNPTFKISKKPLQGFYLIVLLVQNKKNWVT